MLIHFFSFCFTFGHLELGLDTTLVVFILEINVTTQTLWLKSSEVVFLALPVYDIFISIRLYIYNDLNTLLLS